MKSGLSLQQMAIELERTKTAKKDFVAPNAAIEMLPDTRIALKDTGEFTVQNYMHGQLASYTGIPRQYYEKMRNEAPALLADNVNRWLHDEKQTTLDDVVKETVARNADRRMVRTLDGNARAFLSHRYRPIDNVDIAEAVLPVLLSGGQSMKVESSALTEQRMYIKAVSDRFTLEVKKGDPVQAGIVISNSEVGAGSVKIEPLVFRLVCLNGAIAADASMRKYHVGRGHRGEGVDVTEFLRDSTRRADDRAFMMKVQDVVRAAFNEVKFKQLVEKMQGATRDEIKGDPIKVVELAADKFGFTEKESSSVLQLLIKGGDMTRYGLLNAVTAASQGDSFDYERATEFERIGGTIIELPQAQWKEFAEAA